MDVVVNVVWDVDKGVDQRLTLVDFSAQVKPFLWDRGSF